MTANERIAWVDYAKGIAITLIVLLHVLSGVDNANLGLSTSFSTLTPDTIASFATPAFFFLTGLFVEKSFTKRGCKKFVVEKATLLLYPYLIWSLMLGGLQTFMAGYTNEVATLTNIWRIWYLPLGYLWFLYTLTMFYLVYAVTAKFKPHTLSLLVTISTILFFLPINTPIATLEDFSSRFLFFVAGIAFRKYALTEAVRKVASPVHAIVISGIFLASALFAQTKINSFFKLGPEITLPLALLGILATILIANSLSVRQSLPQIVTIGKYTLPIYLAHPIFASGARIILDRFLGYQNPIVHVILGLSVGILLPIWLYQFSQKINFPYFFTPPK
ncbi:MAG: acyltransferase [Anaerolineales bacterium]|nr:acyltransferase [Anaerolineales bacterium]